MPQEESLITANKYRMVRNLQKLRLLGVLANTYQNVLACWQVFVQFRQISFAQRCRSLIWQCSPFVLKHRAEKLHLFTFRLPYNSPISCTLNWAAEVAASVVAAGHLAKPLGTVQKISGSRKPARLTATLTACVPKAASPMISRFAARSGRWTASRRTTIFSKVWRGTALRRLESANTMSAVMSRVSSKSWISSSIEAC